MKILKLFCDHFKSPITLILIHIRSVSLVGDVIDPEGTLSGGTKLQANKQRLRKIKRVERDIKERTERSKRCCCMSLATTFEDLWLRRLDLERFNMMSRISSLMWKSMIFNAHPHK
uniref:Uncharacterized protein n=1 Tax=Glossina pallidipes TaxID=7398 RepID=A0A1B0AIV2_GLOPL